MEGKKKVSIYVDTGALICFFLEEGWKVIEDYFGSELEEHNVEFCISPFTLEEFFYTILYKDDIIRRIVDGKDVKEKVSNFFEKYGKRFAEFLGSFRIVGAPSEITFLFANKKYLSTLTSKVRTYDLLHLLVAIASELDGIITKDDKFVKWLKRNKKIFEGNLKEDFKIFLINLEDEEIQIYRFKDL